MAIPTLAIPTLAIRPDHVHAVQAILGEGPVWLPHARALWFTDIKARRLHRYDPEAGALRSWDAPDQPGWVLPADDRSLVAGLQSGLHRFDPEGGLFAALHDPEPHLPGNRLNDAAVHPDGSLWFGTMDDAERAPTGRLYRFGGAGAADSGLPAVTITNGPAFSPDGAILHHADTLGRTIWRVPLAGGTPFARIEDGAGYPDGLTVDAEGCVLTGLFGGGDLGPQGPVGGRPRRHDRASRGRIPLGRQPAGTRRHRVLRDRRHLHAGRGGHRRGGPGRRPPDGEPRQRHVDAQPRQLLADDRQRNDSSSSCLARRRSIR